MIAASDPETGDHAAAVAEVLVFTVMAFFAAHVYALLLGDWSRKKRAPDSRNVKEMVVAQSPMLTVISVPVIILLLAVLEVFPDQTAVNLALYACVGELAATAWYASRGAGASRRQSVIAVVVAIVIGVAIIGMKAALH
ncbi:unannotated protein [freshwater metagenome]|uniref:Unannotated protein n=1 Tax=freshwater metagenome TaxID=449393 RepID=A0A6J6A0Q0_9ZZZZ|nr:hypothetical protein [Actinomycetota bacterium]